MAGPPARAQGSRVMDWNTLGFALFGRPVTIHLSPPRILFTKDVFEELLQSVQRLNTNEQ
jgi:hypothetical protein